MLQISELEVRYGRGVHALRGVTLTVPDRSVVALLGANGAGKTTVLRSITGLLPRHRGHIDGGSIEFNGRSLVTADAAEIVRWGVAHVPEGRRVFSHLSVDENLRAAGAVRRRGERAAARESAYAMFPMLANRRTERAGLLSGGEQQMLAIGRGLMASPSLLLLDEPSLGLAPKVVEQVAQVIRDISAQGVAVLLVEQNAAVALSVADSAYVLELGQVGLAGSAADIAASPDVRRLYLGHSMTDDEEPSVGLTAALKAWTG
jgi:branched-chain amino acid transport system ATP-binding protein